jgi:hypothetical protein
MMGILAHSQPSISPPSRPVTPSSLATAVVGDRVLERQRCSVWGVRGLGPWLRRCDVILKALTVVMLLVGKAGVARCVLNANV